MEWTWVVARCRACTQEEIEYRYRQFFRPVIGDVMEFYHPSVETIPGKVRLLLPRYLFVKPQDVKAIRFTLWEQEDVDVFGFFRSRKGSISLISEEEMIKFKEAVGGYGSALFEPQYEEGDAVFIERGPLRGNYGRVMQRLGSETRVLVEKVSLSAYITLPATFLSKVS